VVAPEHVSEGERIVDERAGYVLVKRLVPLASFRGSAPTIDPDRE
jgi:hypothetical protein